MYRGVIFIVLLCLVPFCAAERLTPSKRFGPEFEARSFPAAACELPPWAEQARDIIKTSTFPFMGAELNLVRAIPSC